MKLILIFTLIASLVITLITAENIYISFPGPGVSWNPGANVSIRWIVNSGGIPVDAINLDIMDGDANNAVLVKSIATNIQAKYGVYNWVVPVDFEKRSDYFIRATGAGQKGISYFYSGRFVVNGPVWAATVPSQPWQRQENERLHQLETSRKEEEHRIRAEELSAREQRQKEEAKPISEPQVLNHIVSENSRLNQLQAITTTSSSFAPTTSLIPSTAIAPTTAPASSSTSFPVSTKTASSSVSVISSVSTVISTSVTQPETSTENSSAAALSFLVVVYVAFLL